MSAPGEELFEGEEAMVTVMFVDIRDFTKLADRATAREAAALLNDFFGTVVPLLERHGGHVHQLLGDGVLGIFGAPQRTPDHAERALAAAADILAAVEARFGGHLRIGIGVNSGLVLVGRVHGGGREELGVIGDPVNVAARVEKATREVGDPVLVTAATRCLLDGPSGLLEPRGEIAVRGKPAPIRVYALSDAARARRNAFRTAVA